MPIGGNISLLASSATCFPELVHSWSFLVKPRKMPALGGTVNLVDTTAASLCCIPQMVSRCYMCVFLHNIYKIRFGVIRSKSSENSTKCFRTKDTAQHFQWAAVEVPECFDFWTLRSRRGSAETQKNCDTPSRHECIFYLKHEPSLPAGI